MILVIKKLLAVKILYRYNFMMCWLLRPEDKTVSSVGVRLTFK